MHLTAPVTANAATQQPPAQTIDADHHRIVLLNHLDYFMGFQSQLFSDKCLDEHLESDPLFVGLGKHNKQIGQRCSFPTPDRNFTHP